MTDEGRPTGGIAALMAGLVDYAGLFPPAGLTMADAVAHYQRYRASPAAWALGRFVVSISRLEELEAAAARLPYRGNGADAGRWPVTVLLSRSSRDECERVVSFNESHADGHGKWLAEIGSVELKVASAAEIDQAAKSVPPGVDAYFEVPGADGVEELCRAAAASGHALKIRTGGTTVDAFPPSAAIARVIAACAASRVPFKATAGLHHPVRAVHPVTYEPSAPRTMMHGFLNVFVAACLLFVGQADAALATQVLEDELPASFTFSAETVGYRHLSLTVPQIIAARRFARSFGSCSFEEPLASVASL